MTRHQDIKPSQLNTFTQCEDAIASIESDYQNIVGGLRAWDSGYETKLTQGAQRKIDAIAKRQEELDNIEALKIFKRTFGRSYKTLIRNAWETGNYGPIEIDNEYGESLTPTLQDMRNQFGPRWLARVSVKLETTHDDVILTPHNDDYLCD